MSPVDMSQELLGDLISKGVLSLLQFSAVEWDEVGNTRNGISRFSLIFDHSTARSGKKNSLVLIAVASFQFFNPLSDLEGSPQLYLGIVNSVAPVATFSSRVVFSSIEKIAPASLEVLLDRIIDAKLRGAATALRGRGEKYSAVSPKLSAALIQIIAGIPENRAAMQRILARLDLPRRFDNARALQQDAVRTALRAFGAGPEAEALELEGRDTALARVRLREDMVIEHDARSVPGWSLRSSYQTGRATSRRAKNNSIL